MGVGAYFDGERFLAPGLPRLGAQALLRRRHGRADRRDGHGRDLRPERAPSSSARSARIAPLLRAHGHVGYVNLNTIVNEARHLAARVHLPLRLSGLRRPRAAAATRLGANCSGMMAARDAATLRRLGRASRVGIVLTTPPFPLLAQAGRRAGRPAGHPARAARRGGPAPPPLWRGRPRRRPAGHQRPLRLDDGGDRDRRHDRGRRSAPPMRAPAGSPSPTCATGSTSATGSRRATMPGWKRSAFSDDEARRTAAPHRVADRAVVRGQLDPRLAGRARRRRRRRRSPARSCWGRRYG